MRNKNSSRHIHQTVLAAVLIALILVMSYTPIGYLKIGVIEITFLTIPVAIGAVILGPWWGLLLGGVFGLTSFLQCVTGTSQFGVLLLNANPLGCFLTCMVPRLLIGLLTGLLFRALSAVDKTKLWSFPVSTIAAAVTNTVFFVGFLLAFFGRADFITAMGPTVGAIIWALVGVNGLVEIAVCCVLGAALSKAIVHFLPTFGERPARHQSMKS